MRLWYKRGRHGTTSKSHESRNSKVDVCRCRKIKSALRRNLEVCCVLAPGFCRPVRAKFNFPATIYFFLLFFLFFHLECMHFGIDGGHHGTSLPRPDPSSLGPAERFVQHIEGWANNAVPVLRTDATSRKAERLPFWRLAITQIFPSYIRVTPYSVRSFHPRGTALPLKNPRSIMSSQSTVTRIACFRFKETVTAEQKGDRARAFLGLYEQHQDLIVAMPKGGKPLNTPLNLTNVKRDSAWDTLFTVTFKVSSPPGQRHQDSPCGLTWTERRGSTEIRRRAWT